MPRGFRDDRLGMECDSQSCGGEHRQVIRPIANGDGLL